MTAHEILHIIRNPWGWSEEEVRQARIAAAYLIEQHEAEIVRLLDSREREGDRLDWLLARISGDELRRLVGEMGCTSDVSEWRDKIDKAMGYKTK